MHIFVIFKFHICLLRSKQVRGSNYVGEQKKKTINMVQNIFINNIGIVFTICATYVRTNVGLQLYQ